MNKYLYEEYLDMVNKIADLEREAENGGCAIRPRSYYYVGELEMIARLATHTFDVSLIKDCKNAQERLFDMVDGLIEKGVRI